MGFCAQGEKVKRSVAGLHLKECGRRTAPMQKLGENELKDAIGKLPGWRLYEGKLVRDFEFADFVAAMAFVNQVAEAAESAGHHPDIDIRYNKVRLGLVTHDAGGITAKDAEMAAHLNETVV
jgi:4a-hydroxytetrahydrobiopterin dehydratase